MIRPMPPDDVPVAERLSAEGFYELDRRTDPPRLAGARAADAGAHASAGSRGPAHFLETDPGGCWVAEDDSGMVGFATSLRRELMWCLATYAVRPRLQGQGIGRRAARRRRPHHGRGCLRGMLSASIDPKAVRATGTPGSTLHPQMFLTGTVDRTTIPVVEKVREGVGRRRRADGLPRPPDPRRRARPRPRS